MSVEFLVATTFKVWAFWTLFICGATGSRGNYYFLSSACTVSGDGVSLLSILSLDDGLENFDRRFLRALPSASFS